MSVDNNKVEKNYVVNKGKDILKNTERKILKSVKNVDGEKKDKIKKQTTSKIMDTIIVMLVLAILFLIVTYVGVFKKSVIIDNICETHYISELKDNMENEIYDYTLPSGVPVEVLDNIFSLDDIKKDVKKYSEKAIKGRKYDVDTSIIEKRLNINMENYLRENNLYINEKQKENFAIYRKDVCDFYATKIEIPFMSKFLALKEKYEDVMYISLLALIILLAITVLNLYKLQNKMDLFVKNIIYSFIAVGLVSIFIPASLLVNGLYKKIELKPVSFYNLIVFSIEKLLLNYMCVGAIVILLSLIMIAINRSVEEMNFTLHEKKEQYPLVIPNVYDIRAFIGDVVKIGFSYVPKYAKERLEITIYDSDGTKVATSSKIFKNNTKGLCIDYVTDWDTQKSVTGRYTIEVKSYFYKLKEWNEVPVKTKCYANLI